MMKGKEMDIKKIAIALSSAVLLISTASQASSSFDTPSSGDTVAAPFSFAKSIYDEESLDMQAKKARIAAYVDQMPAANFTRLVSAVGTERFIPKQTLFAPKLGKTKVAALTHEQRLDKVMQSKAAAKQLKNVLSQYLYADASRPVYAGLSGGMLATRMPVPSN